MIDEDVATSEESLSDKERFAIAKEDEIKLFGILENQESLVKEKQPDILGKNSYLKVEELFLEHVSRREIFKIDFAIEVRIHGKSAGYLGRFEQMTNHRNDPVTFFRARKSLFWPYRNIGHPAFHEKIRRDLGDYLCCLVSMKHEIAYLAWHHDIKKLIPKRIIHKSGETETYMVPCDMWTEVPFDSLYRKILLELYEDFIRNFKYVLV